jgi:hypothetical protein
MELGKHISFPPVPTLGLDAMSADLPESELRRNVKIYKVPPAVSADRYFVSVSDAGGVEVVPPSRSKDNLLLADYVLANNGDVSINYVHKEVLYA